MSKQQPELLNRIEIYLKKEGLLAFGDHIVIAVSGGPDSMTLLDLLSHLSKTWQLTLHIAHLDHQLRATSQSDANFVRKIAKKYGYPVHIHTENVNQRAKSQKQSIEEAARYARREFLDTVRQETSAHRIALGHTKSDQAETVLLRLIRGSGLTGLGGIRPISDKKWIRPLLSFSRSEIEAYVKDNSLEVRLDETNADPTFLRNRIRKDLIPSLRDQYNPQIEDVLARASTLLQDDDAHLEIIAQQAFSETLLYSDKRKIILDVTRFFGYHISLRRRLIRIALFALCAKPKTTGFRAIERVLHIASDPGRRVQVEPEISAHRTNEALIITRPAQPYHISIEPNAKIDINGTFSTDLLNTVDHQDLQHTTDNTAFFDLDQLPSQKLYLRSPQPGDTFQPFGMQGNKKVSRLLGDYKIPRPIREEIPLLVSGTTILWVVGFRRAQIAPVTSMTQHVLKATFDSSLQSIINI